jgi:DNA mismatch repair ATPase MutL
MENKIRLLPEIVANQIAAGEVVDNPSSVVKEMMENAIDAGAKSVTVNFRNAGLELIQIIDDGCGMSENELYEAMRYGSTNPLVKRKENDLGRFGLGLKSASLSQCRKLVVISKKDGKGEPYEWFRNPGQCMQPVCHGLQCHQFHKKDHQGCALVANLSHTGRKRRKSS